MGKLTSHFAKMQEMASRYLEPAPYTDHEGETWNASAAGYGFIKDMIWMLDGPEQREAQQSE